jgi:hypothetical protein
VKTKLALPRGLDFSAEVADALARARVAETLVDHYDAWLKLRLARSGAQAERQREAERLEQRASLVLGTVETARHIAPASSAPAKGRALAQRADPLGEFVEQAQAELAAARRALEQRGRAEEHAFDEALTKVRSSIVGLARKTLAHYRPRLEVTMQPVGAERSLVHLGRPSPDDAVLLCYLLTGKLFTRYDAFFDDAVDDADLPPPRFYAEEGNPVARLPTIDDEDALSFEPERLFVPFKGFIPFRVAGQDFPRFRIVNRGPVAEVEARQAGGAYQALMARADAELFTGWLLRLNVEAKLELALTVA